MLYSTLSPNNKGFPEKEASGTLGRNRLSRLGLRRGRAGGGRLVFTTGMVGYLETLTDPSYAGQIVLQTFPLIGNYGVIEADFEGEVAARGYVVREWCDAPSNFRCEYDLDRFLKERGVPGICGVDTRAITAKIRESGVMNAMIIGNPGGSGRDSALCSNRRGR